MLRLISFLIDRILVVFGALLFCQIPNFFVHYTQRLGGHIDELKLQIDNMQHIAQKSGKTLPEFIHKFQFHPDNDISLQGNLMQEMTIRYMDLSNAYVSLLEATPLTKPFVFIKNLQWNIAQMTFQDFHWGFSMTLESLIYAFFGMLSGYLVFSMFRYLGKRSIPVVIKK